MTREVIIFGNGGELTVAATGEVLSYEPSEEVTDGDHDGYGDVIHVDLVEWCGNYGLPAPGAMLDILDVDCHLADGTIVEHEESWRHIELEYDA